MEIFPCREQETLRGEANLPSDANILGFWRWAFSDLCDDGIRGAFAEWIVGLLLGIPLGREGRISWADSDFVLPSGLRIEVKSASYWQSWRLWDKDGTRKAEPQEPKLNPGDVRFRRLKVRPTSSHGPTNDQPSFKSHVYIFCMQTEEDPGKWNVLDLSQWQFYVMERNELEKRNIGSSISLAFLREVRPPMTAAQFQAYAREHFRCAVGGIEPARPLDDASRT
jgi:hypothetical protein